MLAESLLSGFSIVNFNQIPTELFFSKRKDHKYLFHTRELNEILDHLTHHYHVVSNNDQLISTYDTKYLDTVEYRHYHEHLHGRMNRIKYRVRTYEDGKSYFEIKGKRNTGHTTKTRVEMDALQTNNAEPNIPIQNELEKYEYTQNSPLESELMQLKDRGYREQLEVRYDRITFYSSDFTEKITIDLHLHFEKDGSSWTSDSLVIAESKMASHGVSVFRELMKALHIRQSSFSKYCFGIATLVPSIKRNNFKQLLRTTEKLITKYEISSNHI